MVNVIVSVEKGMHKFFKTWCAKNEEIMKNVINALIEGMINGDERIISYLEEKLSETLRER